MLELCRTLGLEAYKINGSYLPFEGSPFDSLILDNLLEHISKPPALLNSFARVLESGKLLIGVPD